MPPSAKTVPPVIAEQLEVIVTIALADPPQVVKVGLGIVTVTIPSKLLQLSETETFDGH